MALASERSDHQAQAQAAALLQVSETDLAAAVRELLCRPAADFDAAAQRILHQNEELDRQLA